jgi:hypothetical protein
MLFDCKLIRCLVVAQPSKPNLRVKALSKVFQALQTAIYIFSERTVIEDIEGKFRRNVEQRDSYEFLLNLLSTLVQENSFGEAFDSLFEIRYTETTMCLSCPKQTNERECYILELSDLDNLPSIQSRLEQTYEGECFKCSSETKISNAYITSPQYLFVHPNWSQPDPSLYHNLKGKSKPASTKYENRNTEANYVSRFEYNEYLKLGKVMYRLIGVVQHSGDNYSGHYSYYQNGGSGRWRCFSDSLVNDNCDKPCGRAIIAAYELTTKDEVKFSVGNS